MRSSSAGVKRRGSRPLTITASRLRSSCAESPSSQLERLGHRHLGRQRDRHIRGAGGVGEQLLHLPGLFRDRAYACDRAECLRRAQQPEGVAGGRCVDHDEVVPAPAAPAALPARELPDLDHAHELFRAGRGRREVLERAARGEHPAGEPPGERLQPLEQRLVGVDRDARQALLELDLGAGGARGTPEQRRHLRLLADLHDDRAAPLARRQQRDRGGHRRLAHATLAGDHEQLAVED